MVEVKAVENKRDLKTFINFPHRLYCGDTNYVPELYMYQKQLFNKKKYHFFKHSEAEFFLALHKGNVVGRIAAIKNNNHNKHHNDRAGFFGFFEVIEDYEVAKSLLDTAANWLKKEGLTSIIGPENYTTNDSCGVLIHGFNRPPKVLMPYNKTYYPEFLTKYGFVKKMDLFAYRFTASVIPERVKKLSKKIEKRLKERGIIIRSIDFNKLYEDIMNIRDVYNSASEGNWGFVPLTEGEFMQQAENIKTVIDSDPDYILVAEIEETGRLIGYSCTLPDINQGLIKLKKGRLFPLGIFKLLYHKKKIDSARVLILGVMEKYRHIGIDVCFYVKITEILTARNIITAEASYVMENNQSMNRVLKKINGQVYKKYRIYEREI